MKAFDLADTTLLYISCIPFRILTFWFLSLVVLAITSSNFPEKRIFLLRSYFVAAASLAYCHAYL
jgi:hypothetical protein